MRRILAFGLALSIFSALAGPLRAEEPAGQTSSSPPRIDVDRLFEVPTTAFPRAQLRRGGRDREGWQDAFGRVRGDISELATRIDNTETELHAFVQPDTQFSPLGGAARSDPKVIQLRQQLARDRQSLETARRRLRDLDIEAALAGVPRSWRAPSPPSSPTPAPTQGH